MAILDIIASDITQVGQSDFTANNAVLDVAVHTPAAFGLAFANGNGRDCFQLGDNLLIQKIWAVIPFGFGQGGPGFPSLFHYIGLEFYDGTDLFDLPCFIEGSVVLPTLCEPLDFGNGLFCPMATTGPIRSIQLTNIKLRVSQVNLPAALNGQVIQVQYFMQVLHTLPMTLRA